LVAKGDFWYSAAMTSTRVSCHVKAPRAKVYAALLDEQAVSKWMVPNGMRSEVHAFEGREGGTFRISLTYDAPAEKGKTSAHTDTYHGTFTKLVPNERVEEVVEFETDNPALRGEMTITYVLRDTAGGTEVEALHDALPSGVSAADNELGWRMSLAKLAALVEATGAFRVCGAPVLCAGAALRADAPTGARAPRTLCTHWFGLGTFSVPHWLPVSWERGPYPRRTAPSTESAAA
jgi:uncharacterized protein YndB with AHSA1/START domain